MSARKAGKPELAAESVFKDRALTADDLNPALP